MLESFESNEERDIRAAGDWRTPPEELIKLAMRTESEWVLDAMSRNSCAPPSAIEEIARRGNAVARRSAAMHRACPPEAFELFAEDAVFFVRHAAARRFDAPEHVAAKLRADEDVRVRNAALDTEFCKSL